MSTPNQPEEFPPQAGGELPDLSWREFGPKDWDAQEGDLDGNPNGADQQSIFSKRSGIQDPLIRPESRNEEKAETRTDAESDVATTDIHSDEQELAEPEEVEIHPTERKGRGSKPKRRLVKSKRHLERARRRQKNYLQERRDKKRLRVFFHRIKMILKLCFVVLWGVLLWQTARNPLWNFDQPRFTLSAAHLMQPIQVAPWVKQQVGKPIYAIDTGKLARKIQKNFDIAERVVVRREMFPTRLEIMIQEKQPWAEIYAADPNPRPAHETERVAETAPSLSPKPMQHPYGLVVPSGIISLNPYHYQAGAFGNQALDKLIVAPGTVFSLAYLERLRELTWQAKQINGLHLQSVDVRNPNRIIFNYAELPVVLGRMNGTATERLARLIPLIPKIEEYHDGMQSLDLQWEEQVTFHQKPNAKLDLPKQAEQPQG